VVTLAGEHDVATMSGGRDRWHEIVPDDYFDPHWVPGDEVVGDGVQCLADHTDVGLLLVPDLYDPQPIVEADDVTDPVTLCGPDFAPHVEIEATPPSQPPAPGLDGLRLDPLVPTSLDVIIGAQRRLVDYAEVRRDLTVLLDVPPGLPQRRMLNWRNEFDSEFTAAYHPWLDVATIDDQRDALVRINPSSFAAGIIAEREIRLGVQHGPANELARGAVRVADQVSPERHDDLHVNGINVFVPERDGIRLTGARTLSRRLPLRQLNVARLLAVLRLTLQTEMHWAVFEPNSRVLWAEVRRLIHDLLTRFYEAGAFRGATTKEAFFVRCDRSTMTTNDLDSGRMICLVGVAPAEPVEYILIEVALSVDRGVSVQVAG
jgi:phage tail sheath protein FI